MLQAWLGPKLAASAGRFVQHGVIHELRDGHHPPDLLESPLGAFVRKMLGNLEDTVLESITNWSAQGRS